MVAGCWTAGSAAAGVAAAGAAALLAACGDDSNKGGPSPGVVRAEIVGPASIAPGQTASYSIIEYLVGGGTRALRKRASPALTVVARTLTSSSVGFGSGLGTSSIRMTSGGP